MDTIHSSLWKDNLREIKQSLARFLSILAIIALGVSFFVGIKQAGPSMKLTAANYYDQYDMPDGRIYSTLGLDESDIDLLSSVEGIDVLPMQTMLVTEESQQQNIQLMEYNPSSSYLFYDIIDGRLPESKDEIVLDDAFKYDESAESETGYQIGDEISLSTNVTNESSESDDPLSLEQTEFTVVGFARTPIYYDRTQRPFVGANAFAVVLDDVIQGDIFTQAFYWDKGLTQFTSFSEDYENMSQQRAEAIEDHFKDQPDIRLAEIKREAQKEIDDARKEIEDGYQQLSDGEEELKKAKEELDSGWSDYEEGLADYQDGLDAYESGQAELADQELLLNSSRAELDAGYNQLIAGRNQIEAGFNEYYNRFNQFQNMTAGEQERLLEAQAAIDAGKKEIENTRQQLAQAQERLDEESAKLQRVQSFIDQYSDGVDAETLAGLQASGALEDIQAFLPDYLKDPLTLELEQLKGQLDNLQQADNKLTDQVSDWADDQTAVKQAQQNVIEEFSPLYNKYYPQGEYSGYNDFINQLTHALQADINRLQTAMDQPDIPQKQIDQATRRLEAVNTEIEQVKSSLNQVEADLAMVDTEQTANQIQQLQNEINSHQELISSLEIQMSGLVNQEQTPEIIEQQTRLQSELAQTRATLDQLNHQLVQAKSVQESALALQNNYNQLMQDYESLLAEQSQLQAQLDEWVSRPNGNQQDMVNQLNQLIQQLNRLEDANNPIRQAQAELDAQQAQIEAGRQQLAGVEADLSRSQAALDSGFAQIQEAQQALDAAYGELTQAQNQLAAAEAQLNNGDIEWQNGWQLFNDAQNQLNEARDQLEQAETELEDGRQELEDGQAEYDEQASKFEDEKESALAELEDAEEQLAEAESDLADLQAPTYEFLNQTDNYAYQSLENNANQLSVISNIFPVFFFLIAILVTYTTIKRMVSEQRNYVGTLMQLGYPRHLILSKFVTYAFLSASIGIVLGWIVGHLVFPPVIMAAYNILYYFDSPTITVSWFWNILIGLIALLTAVVPAVIQPYQLLKLQPAELLRPEPPRAGGKILLENWTWFWNRLPFKLKMVTRNLFRYKGRNAMTLLGVAGCTMLMVTGYGISDTLNHLIEQQSQNIQVYDSVAYLDAGDTNELENLITEIEQVEDVESTYPVYQERVEVKDQNGQLLTVNVAVPLGPADEFSNYMRLKSRDSDQLIDLGEEGPIINERLAEQLDQDQLNQLVIRDDDFNQYTIPVGQVFENYVQHYIYMTPDQYNNLIGGDMQANVVYINYNEAENFDEIDKTISEKPGVLTVMNLEDNTESITEALSSLDLITIVLIIAAAALAFVVLYNLTNINIGERLRELSTIKVLGFYDYEVSLYVYGEILVITIIGGFLGMGLGYLLTAWLMKMMQMPDILFHPVVKPMSYLYSFILTILFSAIVMLVMHFKLKKVDVVESLKAIE